MEGKRIDILMAIKMQKSFLSEKIKSLESCNSVAHNCISLHGRIQSHTVNIRNERFYGKLNDTFSKMAKNISVELVSSIKEEIAELDAIIAKSFDTSINEQELIDMCKEHLSIETLIKLKG